MTSVPKRAWNHLLWYFQQWTECPHLWNWCVVEIILVYCFNDNKGVINKPLPQTWGVMLFWGLWFQTLPYKLATMELIGVPIAAPSICSWCLPWNTKYVLFRQNSKSDDLIDVHRCSFLEILILGQLCSILGGHSICHNGNNTSHLQCGFPSATLALTPTNHWIKWLPHLPQWHYICHK